MNTALQIVWEYAGLTFFLKIDVGGGLNCALHFGYQPLRPSFWISSIHSAKFGQKHAAVTITAASNHIPQFPERRREDNFWQIIAEMNILLFLKGARHARRSPPCVRHCM